MKNQQQTAGETAPTMNAQQVQIALREGNVNDDFFNALEAAEESVFEEAEASYLEFVEGEVNNLIFLGFISGTFKNPQTGENEDKRCAHFEGRGGQKFINANAVIVNTLDKVDKQTPFPVRIVCTGTEKSSTGQKYKKFKILYL